MPVIKHGQARLWNINSSVSHTRCGPSLNQLYCCYITAELSVSVGVKVGEGQECALVEVDAEFSSQWGDKSC